MPYTQPVPLLDLKAQYARIREEVRAAFDRVADAQFFIGGPEVEGLEREIAEYSQCNSASVTGTDALLVALMAIGIKPETRSSPRPTLSSLPAAVFIGSARCRCLWISIRPASTSTLS
jgi:hypothetical protein